MLFNHFKNNTIIGIILGLLSTYSFADNSSNIDYSGIYAEAQFGWNSPHNNIEPLTAHIGENLIILSADSAASFAGKVNLGYQFNQNYAIQAGVFEASGYTTSNNPSFKSALYYYDLAGKIMYPLSQHFGVYGLLGVVYATQSVSGSEVSLANNEIDPPNQSVTAILPEAGVGLSVYFTPKFSASVSVTGIPGHNGISPNWYVPLGLSYRF